MDLDFDDPRQFWRGIEELSSQQPDEDSEVVAVLEKLAAPDEEALRRRQGAYDALYERARTAVRANRRTRAAANDDAAPKPIRSPGDDLDQLLADLPMVLDGADAPLIADIPGEPPAAAVGTPSPVTKNGKKRRRRTYARDRRSLDILPVCERTGRHGNAAPLVHVPSSPSTRPSPPPTSITVPSTTPSTPTPERSTTTHTPPASPPISTTSITSKRHRADESDKRRPPSWEHATEVIRTTCFNRAVQADGSAPVAFTLNLGGRVLKAANDNPGGFLTFMRKRFEYHLGVKLGIEDYWFAIEATTAGRYHLHGAIGCNDNLDLTVLKAALEAAGGNWEATSGREYQADVRVQFNFDGWTHYTLKDMARTRRLLGVKKIVVASTGCKERAKKFWEAARVVAKTKSVMT